MTTPLSRPSGIRLFLIALPVLALAWIVALKLLTMSGYSPFGDASMIRRLLLLILPPLLLAGGVYAGYTVWAHKDDVRQQSDRAAMQGTAAGEETAATAARRDPSFTLEIRRLGVTVDRFRQRAVLMRLDEAGQKGTLLLQDPKAYPYAGSDRDSAEGQRENNVFGYTLRQWVDYWPIPVIVVGPPRNASNPDADRMATHINGADNGAGIGNTLYIQLDEIHTEHGDDVIARLFEFFDTHPDLPAAVVLVEDGLVTRALMRTPGEDYLEQSNVDGYFVPKRPDSFVALLVTRKDRVDRLIRPYVVDTPEEIDNTKTQYDVIKLWNYFWSLQKPYWQEGKQTLPWDYWQSKLAEFWKTTPLKAPAGFKPNPWVPVPWTTWQLKEYDDWPVLAYLHRPVRIDLSDGHGEPLKKGERLEKLRAGWQQSLATLPSGEQPGQMFFDTGASTSNLALLVQALHDNAQHIDLDDPKDAFDMQRRIGGDTGTSSTWVQVALAVMMGYSDGKTSALINLRDPLHATIIMMTPPDAASRQAHPQKFSWDF
ncbi:type VI lipase adapter Tla3 domain-containing protein [Paraburkholderia megapolitana]|uniref:type VI lipase adapter Tla3 domain-containing protein n=1 Tax=Paraburkholderia megapolitana TaxID=420953 RepID=UPI0038BA2263